MTLRETPGDHVQQSTATAGALAPQGNTVPDLAGESEGLSATVPPPPSPAGASSGNTTSLNNEINVNVAMPSIQMNMMTKGHSLVTRIVWFLFVGWWLSGIFIALGVFFTWTVILMPIGFWFINRIPKAQTLRERTRQFKTEFKDNSIIFTEGHRDQFP